MAAVSETFQVLVALTFTTPLLHHHLLSRMKATPCIVWGNNDAQAVFLPPFFQSVPGSKWRVVCRAFSVGVSFYDNLLRCPYCHHHLQPPPQNHFADVMTHNCLLDFPGRSFISSWYLYKNGREDVKLTGANGKFWYPFSLGIVFWQAMRNMSYCVHTEAICLVCKLHA